MLTIHTTVQFGANWDLKLIIQGCKAFSGGGEGVKKKKKSQNPLNLRKNEFGHPWKKKGEGERLVMTHRVVSVWF